MNGEGDPGNVADDYSYLRREFVTGFETYGPGDFRPDISMGFMPDIAWSVYETIAGAFPAAMDIPAAIPDEIPIPVETAGVEVMVPTVIDPESEPASTVFEDPYWPVTRMETDWDAVYEQYVELNAPKAGYDLPEDPMAHDWGHVFRQSVGAIWPGGAEQPMQPMSFAAPVAALPPGVGGPGAGGPIAIDPRTGKPVCKRRRRRRLLTEGDFNDLMRIATLPNKDTVKVALAKAVGRR